MIELNPPIDAPLRAHLVSLWVEVTNAGGSVGFVAPVSADVIWPTARAHFAAVEAGRAHLLVGRDAERPFGFVFLLPGEAPLFHHVALVARLQVDPARQGEGLGRRLMERAHELAPSLGIEALKLTVRDGEGLVPFYARLGYDEVGRIPGAIRLSPDDVRDEVVMHRWLAPR